MARLFLVLLLLAISVLVDGIQVSIDCGSSDSYKDENSIRWTGDDDFNTNGKAKLVKSSNINSSLPRSMTTLRVFTAPRKNCYSIDAKSGEKVLVRASFYYGNYDQKSSPPLLYLILDGNYWSLVSTSTDLIVFHEIIYVTKSDVITVCIAKLLYLPFISAIEVRSLNLDMYKNVDQKYALIKRRRVSYGTRNIIRYPNDLYDRIWIPAGNSAGLFDVGTNTAPKINISNLDDSPPEATLQNAFIFRNISSVIKLATNLPKYLEYSVYMNLYFSEVVQLNSTEERSFTLSIDDNFTTAPIIPPYGAVLEVTFSNISASGNTTFTIQATENSTLPPLINALEVYYLSPLADETNSDDVDGLNVLKDSFKVLKNWTGDPCLPFTFNWEWIECNDDDFPRVTTLHLGSFNLSGELPDFSSMSALTTIDLHNNSLIGTIPDFFRDFPDLTLLNLSNNNFSGIVPEFLSKNEGLILDVSGNPNLCATVDSCNKTETSSKNGTINSPPAISTWGSRERKANLLMILALLALPVFLLL